MAKKRKYNTEEKLAIHKEAIRIRKMTDAQLATMVTSPKTGETTVLCSGPHLSYNGREPD